MTIRIHHATAKKAENLGVTLVANEADVVATSKLGQTFRIDNAKFAVVLCTVADVIRTDYPGIEFVQTGSGSPVVIKRGGNPSDSDDIVFDADDADRDTDHDNLLADILEAADGADVDPNEAPEGADEEEETTGRVVVALRYKIEYAERGNRNHCGDWLAKQLDGQFDMAVDGVLRFDTDAFTQCLIENGVELVGKWSALPQSGQKGWVGRYRMNGRQRLEFQVAKHGYLMLGGEQIDVPEEDLATLRRKHPKAAPVAEKIETA